MTAPRIVLAGTGFGDIFTHLHAMLSHIDLQKIDPTTLRKQGTQADILIPTMTRIDGAMMDRIDGLRLIQQCGSGLEGVDIVAATQRGIAVANVPTAGTGNAESVAEWCVMAAIAVSRRLPELEQAIRSGSTWGGPTGRALLGKTAGIIGLGGIGQALAARLKPFGMRLIGVKRSPDPALAERLGLDWLGGWDRLSALFHQSDYIFLCVPLTDQTRALVNEETLLQLKKEAYIINVGRGGLLSQQALLQALEEGRLMGSGLDVFEQEPLDPHSSLLTSPNVVATPHIAGVTDVALQGIAQRVADNVQRLLTGQSLQNCVNTADLNGGARGPA